jgi:DNA-binding beta-propeller fold protein YncE
LATLHAGRGASGVSFNPAGTLALVANRIDGTITAFTVSGKTVAAAGTIDLGAADSGPCHVTFTRDGRMALVTRNNDSLISLLTVEGSKVSYAKRDIAAGLKPYPIEVSPTADVAVVGHTGAGPSGGADVLSVIDLNQSPPRTVDHISVGPTAEGLAVSPDGRYVAVTVMDGSNAPKSSPFFHANGRLRVFSLAKTKLAAVAEIPIGNWCQGVGWSRDSRTVFAQCAAQRELQLFRFDGRQLTPAGAVKVSGGPSGLAVGR